MSAVSPNGSDNNTQIPFNLPASKLAASSKSKNRKKIPQAVSSTAQKVDNTSKLLPNTPSSSKSSKGLKIVAVVVLVGASGAIIAGAILNQPLLLVIGAVCALAGVILLISANKKKKKLEAKAQAAQAAQAQANAKLQADEQTRQARANAKLQADAQTRAQAQADAKLRAAEQARAAQAQTDAKLQGLVGLGGLTALQSLNLSSCNQITDKGLMALEAEQTRAAKAQGSSATDPLKSQLKVPTPPNSPPNSSASSSTLPGGTLASASSTLPPNGNSVLSPKFDAQGFAIPQSRRPLSVSVPGEADSKMTSDNIKSVTPRADGKPPLPPSRQNSLSSFISSEASNKAEIVKNSDGTFTRTLKVTAQPARRFSEPDLVHPQRSLSDSSSGKSFLLNSLGRDLSQDLSKNGATVSAANTPGSAALKLQRRLSDSAAASSDASRLVSSMLTPRAVGTPTATTSTTLPRSDSGASIATQPGIPSQPRTLVRRPSIPDAITHKRDASRDKAIKEIGETNRSTKAILPRANSLGLKLKAAGDENVDSESSKTVTPKVGTGEILGKVTDFQVAMSQSQRPNSTPSTPNTPGKLGDRAAIFETPGLKPEGDGNTDSTSSKAQSAKGSGAVLMRIADYAIERSQEQRAANSKPSTPKTPGRLTDRLATFETPASKPEGSEGKPGTDKMATPKTTGSTSTMLSTF